MIELIGNGPIKEQLDRISLELPLGLAWIFQGPRGIGKALLAKQWALEKLRAASPLPAQLSYHPDLHIIKPQGTSALHTMEAMRTLSSEVIFPPTLSLFKVFIIQDAERLPIACSNYLLKTLEEPPADTLFILTTDRPEALPDTIHSRCRTFFFRPLSSEEIMCWLTQKEGSDRAQAAKIAARARGSLGRAAWLAQEQSDEIRHAYISALAREKSLSLSEIIEVSEYLEKHLQGQKNKRAEALEKSLSEHKEGLSPHDLEVARAQIEGEVSLLEVELIHELFEEILLYYRDLWALKYGAKELYHEEHSELLRQVSKKPSFIDIENLLIEAKRQLTYGTKLSLVLQRFFLHLRE